ncbi:hypothetical protein V1264_017022 [Littorina saxatilis]|uniref:Uncharacterized protein n=1 Tax=Littorina saxatilis TaxID=31220 RepID=A0AAN9BIA3_9CAEN
MTAARLSVWGLLGPHFRLRVPVQDTDTRTDRDVNVFTVRQRTANNTGMGPHLHLRAMSRGVQESGQGPSALYCG